MNIVDLFPLEGHTALVTGGSWDRAHGFATRSGRAHRVRRGPAAAVYLASRAGDFVVGSTLTVDGGMAFATSGAASLGTGE